jgi:hypothetical protein
MTPKQAAAKLLLHALDQGAALAKLTREDMAAVLSERVSEVKHARILEFAGKISAPFRERLERIAGAADPEGETPASASSTP